jgi:hypothetical protein
MSDNGTYHHHHRKLAEFLALKLQRQFTSILKPEHFPTAREQQLARLIDEHRAVYKCVPTRGDLIQEMPEEERYIDSLFDMSTNGLHRAVDEVRDWTVEQEVRIAFIESLEALDDGRLNFGELPNKFSRALQAGQDIADLGMDLEDMSWLARTKLSADDSVSTPWKEVNASVGGLAPKELGLMLGVTGGHKTTALINIGAKAAGIINSKNVLHFSLEMLDWKVLGRYSHRIAFSSYRDHEVEAYWRKLGEARKQRIKGKIKVKFYPADTVTVQDLVDFTWRVIDSGWIPGLIIVDYISLLLPTRQMEKRFALDEVTKALRAMGTTFDVPVWSAAQATRPTGRRAVIKDRDVAEAYLIPQTADIMLSTNQTDDEIENDEMRLYTAKIREGDKKGRQIDAKIRYPAIISTGYTQFGEDDNGESGDQ